jgi:hypothetical protein
MTLGNKMMMMNRPICILAWRYLEIALQTRVPVLIWNMMPCGF